MRALAFLLALAGPAAAQEPFPMPQGCEAFVTIQMRDCTVSHHFTCAGDPEGYQNRVDLDEDGITYSGTIDSEAQWIQSVHYRSGHAERLEQDPADPSSFSELLEAGIDTWDFTTLSDEIGPTRYVGEDRLTGEDVVIDGQRLLRTEYQIVATAADGTELWRGTGREFVHPEWRMFLSGQSTYITDGESFDSDSTPVEFIFPGEPGFLSRNPKHGCGMVMSSLSMSMPGDIQ